MLVSGVQRAIAPRPHHAGRQPDEGDDPEARQPHGEARQERPDGGRAGQRAEGEALLVGPAVEDAVDEHRPTDDRGRERVAGQQRHERRGAERPRSGTGGRRGTGRATRRARRSRGAWRRRPAPPSAARRRRRRVEIGPGDRAWAPISVSPTSPAASAMPEQGGTRDIDATGAARRLPAGRGGPGEDQGDERDGHVDVEDPAPGGRRRGPASGVAEPGPDERLLRMDRRQDGRPEERAGGHPEERQRADDPERARPAVALEQVGRSGRPDRDEDAAADRLDEARGDELIEVLGHARQRGAEREDDEGGRGTGRRAPHRSARRPASGIARM